MRHVLNYDPQMLGDILFSDSHACLRFELLRQGKQARRMGLLHLLLSTSGFNTHGRDLFGLGVNRGVPRVAGS